MRLTACKGLLMSHWTEKKDRKYTTTDEISYLRDQALMNPVAFRRYAGLIQAGGRRYDPGIDVGQVKSECGRLLLAIGSGKAAAGV
jgi:hypothetical protein